MCVCVSRAVFHSVPLFLFLSLSCPSAVLCFFPCSDSSRAALQERRVRTRVPISSVVLPRAAAAPPLAELRCDWPHNDSLAHLPVKRLSQFMLPENWDLTVYQKNKKSYHFRRKKKNIKCMQLVVFVTVGICAIIDFIHVSYGLCIHLQFKESWCCPLSVFFAIYLFSCSHNQLSECITVFCSLLSHSCLSRIH